MNEEINIKCEWSNKYQLWMQQQILSVNELINITCKLINNDLFFYGTVEIKENMAKPS